MKEKCVLIIDDDYKFLEGPLQRRLQEYGFRVAGGTDHRKALELIKAEKPDIILLDIIFPDGESKPTLQKIKSKYPETPPVIMISDTMRQSRYNAADYQPADARYPKELLEKKEDMPAFVEFMNNVIESSKRDVEFDFVVGQTQYMKENVVEQIRLVADTDATTVLITGETGTGKESIARNIHNMSARRRFPLVVLNSTAYPDTLLESELFGYEKGAFDQAFRKKLGRIALAEGSTLFLDEIGDITPALQKKLLRVLREKEYDPLGGTKTIKADVRFITATNKNLWEMVQKGQYREDLYYRLKVFHIHLPPLRERMEDIPLLVQHLIEKSDNRDDSFVRVLREHGLREDVEKLLTSYHWPGNIGELKNVIESALILAKRDKVLQPIHFPELIGDKAVRSAPTFNAPDIVDRIFKKDWTWENIKAEYRGNNRRDILLGIVDRFREENGRRPSSKDMASLLSTSPNHARQILAVAKIKLTEPKETRQSSAVRSHSQSR